jgi:Arc/MetJ-type ribon-helix-helix transcriptional regulator
VPNVRGEGQKPVLIMMDEEFIDEIARNLARAGYSDRSSFVRDAVFEKLRRLGIKVDYSKALAPTRVMERAVRQKRKVKKK